MQVFWYIQAYGISHSSHISHTRGYGYQRCLDASQKSQKQKQERATRGLMEGNTPGFE
jgi:hypothetical protein